MAAKGMGPILILGGAAALALAARKKKPKPSDEMKPGGETVDPDEVPKIKSNQVGFSGNYENYKIGGAWRTNVLDKHLDEARLAGTLVYEDWRTAKDKHDPAWLSELVEKFGPPTEWGLAANANYQAMIGASRINVLNDFAKTHFIAIPGGTTNIRYVLDKGTPAAKEFGDMLSEYTLAFQKRDFSED